MLNNVTHGLLVSFLLEPQRYLEHLFGTQDAKKLTLSVKVVTG